MGENFVYAPSNEDYLGDIHQCKRQDSLRTAMDVGVDEFGRFKVRIDGQFSIPVICLTSVTISWLCGLSLTRCWT